MSSTRSSFNVKNGVQKGPGADASYITAMRRQRGDGSVKKINLNFIRKSRKKL